MSSKLYVLVRSNLSRSQQAVQACHAVEAWTWRDATEGAETGSGRGGYGTTVLLQVRDLDELTSWYKVCAGAVAFYEPDIGEEMTAFAVLGTVPGFESLKLL